MMSVFDFSPRPVMMPPNPDGPAGFTTLWHGHGAGHQDNNDPGDAAGDRHNFGDAVAGRSGQNPTEGSQQDDFSAAAGLLLIPVHKSNMHSEDDDVEDDLDMIF